MCGGTEAPEWAFCQEGVFAPNVGGLAAQAILSRGVSAISMKSRFFSAGLSAI